MGKLKVEMIVGVIGKKDFKSKVKWIVLEEFEEEILEMGGENLMDMLKGMEYDEVMEWLCDNIEEGGRDFWD